MAKSPSEVRCLTLRLIGTGARSAEGTNTGHENAEGMPSVGVRVEPTVRLESVVEGRVGRYGMSFFCCTRRLEIGLSTNAFLFTASLQDCECVV